MNKKHDSHPFSEGVYAIGSHANNLYAQLTASKANSTPTFVVGGIVSTRFGGVDKGRAIIVQPDGKIIVAGSGGSYAWPEYESFTFARFNSNGSLDSNFSNDGRTDLLGRYNDFGSAYAIALQADGKILAAGYRSDEYAQNNSALLRLNKDGSLDSSFGSGGWAITDFKDNMEAGTSITVQTDGKILVAGSSHSANFSLVRYNPNGSLDTSFSGNGQVITDFGAADQGKAVTVQANGKILVAGTNNGHFALARYNQDGTLDTSFSNDGKVATGLGVSEGGQSLSLQANGKILVAGTSNGNFALVRYNSNGTLDTSFSGDGIKLTNLGAVDKAYSVALQADGKILLAGTTGGLSYNDHNFALVRYNSDGSLDTSFGYGGKVTTEFFTATDDIAYAITLQADHKILVTGSSRWYDDGIYYETSVFSVARYNPDGSLDHSFGTPKNTSNNQTYYFENKPSITLNDSIRIFDAELSASGNYKGASITLNRHNGASPQDVFSGSGDLILTGNAAILSGIAIGTVSNTNGTLKISFNGNATQARVDAALSLLSYRNNADAPPSTIQIDWTLNDGNTGQQGTGLALSTLGSTVIDIYAVNDAPIGQIAIIGRSTVGQTVAASSNLTDADGIGTISYTWKVDTTTVGTNNSYAIKSGDIGKSLTVTASYRDMYGTQESKTSLPQVVGIEKTGTANADTLTGTVGNDILWGLGGNDNLSGGNGNDRLDGGAGNDILAGGSGNDTCIINSVGDVAQESSGNGNDTIGSYISFSLSVYLEDLVLLGSLATNGTGNNSNNKLIGNLANNTLSGGQGNDQLDGGLGTDTLTGGSGQDIFKFTSALAGNSDKITDFSVSDDTLQLENAIFAKLPTTGTLNIAYLKIGATAADGNDFIIYNPNTGALLYDTDGNGAVAATQIATLGTHLALSNTDFVVI